MGYTVYKHTTPPGKVYIGMTMMRVEDRWKNGNGYETCRLFKRAIDKYGWENIKHEILFEGLTKEEAEAKEIEMIRKYRSNDAAYGYNMENGGMTHGKHSAETLEKMSINRKGKCVGKENPFYGKHHSPEWIESHLCGENNPMYGVRGKDHPRYGIKHTEESIDKMRRAKQGKYTGGSNPKARSIRCIETGEVFACIKDASEYYGVNRCSIERALRGRTRTLCGYHWEFVQESDKK